MEQLEIKTMKLLKKLNQRGFAHIELITAVLVIGLVVAIGGYVYAHDRSHADSPTWTILASSGSGSGASSIQACQTYINTWVGGIYEVSLRYWKQASWSGSYGYNVYEGSGTTVRSTNSSRAYLYNIVGGLTGDASGTAGDHLSVWQNTNNGDLSNTSVNPATLASCTANARAMWVWTDTILQSPSEESSLISFATAHNINVLYFNSEAVVTTDPSGLASFIGQASATNIQVELLAGEPDWALSADYSGAINFLNESIAFAKSVQSNERPVGVTYDIEPEGLSQWTSNQTSVEQQMIELLQQLEKTSNGALLVGAAYPFAFDSYSLTLNNTTMPMTDWMIKTVDQPVLLDYRNSATQPAGDNLVSHAQLSLSYAQSINKKVYLGVETNCDVTPAKVTFCGLGNAGMQSTLNQAQADFTNNSFGGWVIEDYTGYSALDLL